MPHNSLVKDGERLTSIAGIFAVTSFVPHLNHYPFLRHADPTRWDFIVSAACVFLAVTGLNELGLDDETESRVIDVVSAQVAEWNPNGLRAVEACKTMFERESARLASTGYPQQFLATDALGIWIFWNLFDRAPISQSEVEFVRTIGTGVVHEFFTYWG